MTDLKTAQTLTQKKILTINNKKYDEQYGTFNFNLTDISSIFDGSSDFFKFMTASIGILPPIFITILIAFFTIMLAICLVKWVVK